MRGEVDTFQLARKADGMSVVPRLDRLLDESLARDPDRLALACGGRRVSFAQLSDLARRIASALYDAGLAGERVAIVAAERHRAGRLLPRLLARPGVTAVPFEYVDAPPEIRYGLADCAARWLIVHEDKLADLGAGRPRARRRSSASSSSARRRRGRCDFTELLASPPRALPAVPADTLALILYTSGSTALPEGRHPLARLRGGHHRAACSRRSTRVDRRRAHRGARLGRPHGRLDRGLPGALARRHGRPRARFRGRALLPRPARPGGRRCRRARRSSVADVAPPGGAARRLRLGGHACSPAATSCRSRCSALSSISPACRSRSGWGMTEAIWLTIARTPELERRGCLGRPVAEVELRVVDSRRPHRARRAARARPASSGCAGRWSPPATGSGPRPTARCWSTAGCAPATWGSATPSGDYWFTGRLKQIIERNSENITPGEIEQALYRHPAVAEAGAFGVADPDEGQVPIAYVASPRAGGERGRAEGRSSRRRSRRSRSRRASCRSTAMPLTHSGKIDHKALAERYAAGASSSAATSLLQGA